MVLQENCSADYKALDSFNTMIDDPQRINELKNIVQHSSILRPSIKSDFTITPIRIPSKCDHVIASHGPTHNAIKPKKKPQRKYTSLDMSYEVVFDRLHAIGGIFPFRPTLDNHKNKKD